MSTQRARKSLRLKRETLRSLDPARLERAAGGTRQTAVCPSVFCPWTQICPPTFTCQTLFNCPMPTHVSCVGCPSIVC
jgi:hypothetical protein